VQPQAAKAKTQQLTRWSVEPCLPSKRISYIDSRLSTLSMAVLRELAV
jgi:hypothetical protein